MDRKRSKKAKSLRAARDNITRSPNEKIPKITAYPAIRKTLRFRNSAAYSGALNVGGLLMSGGMVAFATNSSACIHNSVKVHRIRIWSAPKTDSTGEFRQANVQWNSSSGYSCTQKFFDTSISNAEPLFVESRPQKDSLAHDWMSLFTVQYCNISLPDVGCIVDIDCSMIQSVSQGINVTTALAATLGHLNYGNLDSTGSGNIATMFQQGTGGNLY
jgi:hypothetical protein